MKPSEDDPIVAHYSKLAADYDNRWSFYLESTIRETLCRLPIKSGDSVLDVGCGTGLLLQAVAQLESRVRMAGVDPTPEMIEIARGRLAPDVELKSGRAEELPFDDGEFSIVVSTSTFHFIREPRKALSEMVRVLEPGGRVVITDWCHDFLSCKVCDVILRVLNRAHGRTYGRRECTQLLEDADLTRVTVERFKINWLWGIMTAVAYKGG
jgi:ubiquinone/menaquinone biosynthesis C-methylase UbiE